MCEGLIGLVYVCSNEKKLVEYEARVFHSRIEKRSRLCREGYWWVRYIEA